MIRGFNSLTVKLSYLMAIIVIATVTVITFQSANKFSTYVLSSAEESSTNMAERTSVEISNIIESWTSQIAATISKLSSLNQDKNLIDEEFSSVLKKDPLLFALSLFNINGASATMARQTLQSITVSEDAKSVNALLSSNLIQTTVFNFAQEVALNSNLFKDDRVIRNFTPKLKIPTVLIALKVPTPNQPNYYQLIILIASMTRLQATLPESRNTHGFVINSDGSIFASNDEAQLYNISPIRGNALISKALLKKSPSGFISDFTDKSKKQKLGSFAQTREKIPLFVIVELDRKAIFQAISKMFLTSTLWGLLILLLTVMCGYLITGKIIKNIESLETATIRIGNGDFGLRLQPVSEDELSNLSRSINSMASRIQNLMISEIEKARSEKDLETAKIVQSLFFPKKDIETPFLKITGSYNHATACGGDLWGHYNVKDGVELVYIADAMGNGAPAALVAAIAFTVCQSVSCILKESAELDPSPGLLLQRLNQIIFDATEGKIGMTFFAALFDFNSGKLLYSNAGHNFPVIITKNSKDARLTKSLKKFDLASNNRAISLTLLGAPLGVDKMSKFNEKTIDICAGDKIFFFTNGLIENRVKGKSPMGRKNLIESVCNFGEGSIVQIKDAMKSLGQQYFGNENLHDDVTIVVAQIDENWKHNGNDNPLQFHLDLPAPIMLIATLDSPELTNESPPQAIPVFELGSDSIESPTTQSSNEPVSEIQSIDLLVKSS